MQSRLYINYLLLPWNIPEEILPWNIPEEISRRSMLFNKLRQYLPYQTCPYNLLPWEWNDLKFDVKWKYLYYV